MISPHKKMAGRKVGVAKNMKSIDSLTSTTDLYLGPFKKVTFAFGLLMNCNFVLTEAYLLASNKSALP